MSLNSGTTARPRRARGKKVGENGSNANVGRKYKYVPVGGHISKRAAEDLGVVLERLGGLGKVPPKKLVDEARDPKSPVHDLFEWDPKKQQELYLLERARYLMRHIEVEWLDVSGAIQRMPAAINLRDGEGYSLATRAMDDKELMKAFEEQAIQDAIAFYHKYQRIRRARGLKPLFDVIEKELITTKRRKRK